MGNPEAEKAVLPHIDQVRLKRKFLIVVIGVC